MGDDGQVRECRINRYTLEAQCQKTENAANGWNEKCRFAGAAIIPNTGKYWISCGVRGKPETDNTFKIVSGSNSTIEGGYLIWKNTSDNGAVTEECVINRYNGAVYCSVPESVAKDASIPKRWDVLGYPTCRVLPLKF